MIGHSERAKRVEGSRLCEVEGLLYRYDHDSSTAPLRGSARNDYSLATFGFGTSFGPRSQSWTLEMFGTL